MPPYLTHPYRAARHCMMASIGCLLFMSCASNPDPAPLGASKGTVLYTQFSMFHEKGVHRTTNYRKGILVPVNTPVTFVRRSKHAIVVQLPDTTLLTIQNVANFSGESVYGILDRTLSHDRLDLSAFTDEEQRAIAAGEVSEGMSKEATRVALGYPPKHRTPSLESNQWRYWSNRFSQFVVHFEDGLVTSIQK
jgi:hypothetical protein